MRKTNTNTGNLLLSRGTDTNALNMHGQTPLLIVAGGEKDCPQLCETLIIHNAKIDAEDVIGNQPLHLACKRHHTETGNLLMSHGADANALNKDGQTPLHAAAGGEKECFLLCKSLVKHDAKVDTVDEDGDHPLHLACKRGHTEIGNHILQSPYHSRETVVASRSRLLCRGDLSSFGTVRFRRLQSRCMGRIYVQENNPLHGVPKQCVVMCNVNIVSCILCPYRQYVLYSAPKHCTVLCLSNDVMCCAPKQTVRSSDD